MKTKSNRNTSTMLRPFVPSFTLFFPTQVRTCSKRPVQLRDQKPAVVFRVWHGHSKFESVLQREPSFSRSFLLKDRNMISRTESVNQKLPWTNIPKWFDAWTHCSSSH